MEELGIELPPVTLPVANYVPAVLTGGYVYTSGQLPIEAGELLSRGHLGAEVHVEEAAAAARVCALNAIAAAAAVAGGVDALVRPVKVTGFVASAAGFSDQATVINGASDLLGEVFGAPHARSAVGVAELPLGAAVEVEVVFEVGRAAPADNR
nr:RidA family protein [Pseudactinotalea sp. HY160]